MSAILTLTEYKARRQLTDTDAPRDAAIEFAIESAEDDILTYTGRNFTTAPTAETKTYAYDGTGILEVDDFETLISVSTSEFTLDASQFSTGPREGPTFYWLDFTASKGFPSYSAGQMGFTRNMDVYFQRHFEPYGDCGLRFLSVNITATFGWPGGAPAGVRQAATWLAGEFVRTTGDVGNLQSESIAEVSFAYQREKTITPDLPPHIQQLLDPYRRVAL